VIAAGSTTLDTVKTRNRSRRSDSKLTEEVVKKAWRRYKRGKSLRAVADELWEELGYASSHACTVALHQAFRLEGYKLRPRVGPGARRSIRRAGAPASGGRP
jgi:hypothetical protein